MRAFRRLLGVLVAGMVCLLVLGGGVALAVTGELGRAGEESGELAEPHGVAVDQETGDVYVADTDNERVDKFSGGGDFLFAWGWGVADGHTEAFQTCTTRCSQGVYGPGAGEFRLPEGVAVDNDLLSSSHGDVYVLDTANNRVEKFDAEGHFLLMFGGEVNEATNGNVCLPGEACREGTSGVGHGQLELGEGGSIAVSPAGVVYVGNVNRVEEFDASGVYAGEVPLVGVGSIKALAVAAGGDVYVSGSELSGVREYNGAGVEQGPPRDASGELEYFARAFISLGAAGELFVADGSEGAVDHLLEFDAAGDELESFGARPGEEGIAEGLAFAEGIGGLYVLSRNSGQVHVVSLPAAGPLLVAQSADELQPTTAAIGVTLNAEGHATSYHVEYGTSTSYGSSTASTPLAGSAFADEPVSVALSGLQPRTTYHYRVVASNSAGTMTGADGTFTTLPPALIDSESVSGVTSSSATLAAQINPLGRDTSYRLEYGLIAAYGSSVPVSAGDAGSGTSDVSVSALVEGLTASTTYHFRVVASNSLGVVDGVDHTFITQGGEAPVLPDGRAWEMVSPPEKRGYGLEGIGALSGGAVQASADGSSIAYVAQGPIDAEPKGNRDIAHSEILSTRTGGGWSSVDVATPHEAVTGTSGALYSEYQAFSPDLSVGLVEPAGDTPLSAQATERTPYLREANGEYTPLVTAGDVPPGTKFGQVLEGGGTVTGDVGFVGASPDLTHVILESSPPLTKGIADTEGRSNLFEWAGGGLRLVSVLPDGKAVTEEGESANLGFLGTVGTGNVRHAVSDDGSRVFWEAGGHLYLRDMDKGETVQLDIAEPGARGGSGTPSFAVASSDGSKVFFLDNSQLTVDSHANAHAADLYMCVVGEVAGKLVCSLKDLTVDRNAGEAADVVGTVIGASEDGRYAYFVADGVLAAGATSGSCRSERNSGESLVCNLYVYDTVLDEVRFVAQLSGEDQLDWEATFSSPEADVLQVLTAGVSPDGRYLAFMSESSLTGYDNVDAHSGQRDVEVFLYDAGAGRLTCASCNPSGARPSGVFDPHGFIGSGLLVEREGEAGWAGHWLAGSLPGWTGVAGAFKAVYRSRYLSDSGRLFFDSADALVPRDANGMEDVYEYEPAGVGSCTGGSGCVGLISSGTSGEESAFMDASESGDDVFFLTASQLVPQDLDDSLDVYDAHVCSASSPCVTAGAAASAPCTTADACRAAQAPQPGVFGAPPSATFSGAGNLPPSISKPVVKKKVLTVAQKRAAALRKCKSKPKRKRVVCEAQARRRYRVGAAKRSVQSSMKKGSR